MTKINALTRPCGLIGFPLDHSLSPLLHNYAYTALGLNYRYMAYPVQPERLKAALQGLTALNFAGVNVTAPHKQEVIPFLDQIDPAAAATGSVNTICCRDGKLLGYSTDGEGFLWSLRQEGGYEPAGKKALLLGAGGAARAVSAALAGQGLQQLVILNRSEQRAHLLAEQLLTLYPTLDLQVAPLTVAAINRYWSTVSLVVNALSADPWPWRKLAVPDPGPGCKLAYDLRYSPPRTEFLDFAAQGAHSTLNGLGMLLAQAALSFALFTGTEEPPFALMKKVLLRVNT